MKDKKPQCPCCRHPGFKIKPWSEDYPFKPIFECDKCKTHWSIGRDGGSFSSKVMNKEIVEETLQKYKDFNKQII